MQPFDPSMFAEQQPGEQQQPAPPPGVAPGHLQPQAVPMPPAGSPPRPLAPAASPSSLSAGTGLLMVVAGTAAGFWLGGPWGAGAGLLLTGAGRNAVRAQQAWGSPDPAQRLEAGKSATMAVFGIGIGGYLSYLAYEARRPRSRRRHHDDED